MGNVQKKPTLNQENPREEEGSGFTCEICVEPVALPNKKFKNRNKCSHPFCLICIIRYIEVKIDDHVSLIRCPALNCVHNLDPLSCRSIIPRQLFDKWCDLLCESALLGFDRCYCPNRDCSALIVNECGGSVKKAKCPKCKKLFCFSCKLAWHAGYRCEESGELRDGSDVAFGVLAERKKWKRCPSCQHFVELSEGCSIVKCRCGIDFCYKCGGRVNRHWCGCRRVSVCCFLFYRFFLIVLVFSLAYFVFFYSSRVLPRF